MHFQPWGENRSPDKWSWSHPSFQFLQENAGVYILFTYRGDWFLGQHQASGYNGNFWAGSKLCRKESFQMWMLDAGPPTPTVILRGQRIIGIWPGLPVPTNPEAECLPVWPLLQSRCKQQEHRFPVLWCCCHCCHDLSLHTRISFPTSIFSYTGLLFHEPQHRCGHNRKASEGKDAEWFPRPGTTPPWWPVCAVYSAPLWCWARLRRGSKWTHAVLNWCKSKMSLLIMLVRRGTCIRNPEFSAPNFETPTLSLTF